ncbi:isoprenylcysteine carboxyl methyltransferase family protein [Campylobacter sputorum]|uniref:isoprenylcysteine carboxyl methyltransferase family protein n=1 Tax=Campylobacter sputorum TaxID=206 RepID=UPI00053BF3AA|nr:isoprenylcysteine carboxyl methyltransferase family protein [Campylobacter sputorum]
MDYLIFILVFCVFVLRLYFLKISKKNEKNILKNGGKEYGVNNTKVITIVHVMFYLFCLFEAIVREVKFDMVSCIGLGLLMFAFFMLYYIVNYLLKDIWTVKLMIAKNHKYNPHFLFRIIKHPNYYLNIFPELVGLSMLCHASVSFIILAPIYLIIMYIRIKEEDNLIKNVIIPNGIKEF